MPIDRKRYPANWSELALACKEAADWCCERCGRRHGELVEGWKAPVRLAATHVGPNKANKLDCSNLKALCQVCHLLEDIDERMHSARWTRTRRRLARARRMGQQELVLVGDAT